MPESDPRYQKIREDYHDAPHKCLFGGAHLARLAYLDERAASRMEDVANYRAARAAYKPELKDEDDPTIARIEYIEEGDAAAREDVFVDLREEFVSLADRATVRVGESYSMNAALRCLLDREPPGPEDAARRTHIDITMFREKQALRNGTITNEELVARVQAYLAAMEPRQEVLTERAEEVAIRVRHAVLEAVEDGWLPIEAMNALPRIDGLPVYLQDWATNQLPKHIVGGHGNLGLIYVTEALLEPGREDELENAIVHELVHELSGKNIAFHEQRGGMLARETKTGLALKGHEQSRFVWLNEAVTEWLCLRLMGRDGFGEGSYLIERQELERLLDAGLDEHVLLDAYFENITNEQPASARASKFAALVAQVSDIEGERGMATLENKILVQQIADELGSVLLVPEDQAVAGHELFPVRVTVRVGVRDDTAQQATFVFQGGLTAAKIDEDREILTMEITNGFNRVRELYAKERVALTLEMPPAPEQVETAQPAT